MKTHHRDLLILALVSFGTLALVSSTAEAGEAKIVGTWKLLHIEKKGKKGTLPPGFKVKMHYKKDHTWEGTMERHGKIMHNSGTWTLTGKALTVQPKGKRADTMTLEFIGKMMKLTKKGDQGTAVFQRIP